MPSETRLVEVKLPEAELLADLYGIAFDLGYVEELCSKAIEVAESIPRDWLVEEALVSAAVIKYGRCFTDGVRMRLGFEDLAVLHSDTIATHEYFIELRHKTVAHAVNAFEETYVNAAARVKDGEKFPITSLSPGQHRVILSSSMAQSLRDLSSTVKSFVKKRIESEEGVLLEFIQALPIDEIHSGDLHRPIGNIDVRKPMKRSKKRVQARSKHRAPDV
jgi:hypothetical protein